MRKFERIILSVIAALTLLICLLHFKHSGTTPQSNHVIVRDEPRPLIRLDRRINHLQVQNATFEQLIDEISKAAQVTIVYHRTPTSSPVRRVSVNWSQVRLDTAVWIAFAVFEQYPGSLFVDEKGRLAEEKSGDDRAQAEPAVLYDVRSIHMVEGDTDASTVTEQPFMGAWEDSSSAYSMSWRVFQNIIDEQTSLHYHDGLARPYLVSERTVDCAVTMRSMLRALEHPQSPGEIAESLQFVGARRIKNLRLTNVSVDEALRRACEASNVNSVFPVLPAGDPNWHVSVELHDVSLSQAISKIFDRLPDPAVGISVREIDGVAVVCGETATIAQYPMVYDVRKIIASPKGWYDPSKAPPIPSDISVDKLDPCLLPGSALASLLLKKLGEMNEKGSDLAVDYWRGRIIVTAPIRAHRGIEKMLAHISKTGRVEDESQ